MEIISRKDAVALGLPTYFTGKPCSRGGIAERRVAGSSCTCSYCKSAHSARECARNYRGDSWGKRNPEGRRAACKKYYNSRISEEALERKIFREQDPDSYHRERLEAYRLRENQRAKRRSMMPEVREKRAEAQRRRLSTKAGKDKSRSENKNWRSRNRDRVIAAKAKRRARKLNATPPWYGELDEFVMREAADLCRLRELATGFAWQVDHMVPLQAKVACGLHCAANIQVMPALLNIAKRNKMIFTEPFDWIASV